MTRKGALAAWLLLVAACSDVTTPLVSDPKALVIRDAGKTGARDDAAIKADAAAPAADASTARVPANCGGHTCACDDGVDNDQDGLTDGFDPECTNATDDDEASFATGAPAPKSRCRDCFWDSNAGPGDDRCRYPEECFTGGTPPGKGACSSCEVSTTCVDYCQSRTPNGCDCFGCCEITRPDGTSVQVQLTDTCSLGKLDDHTACPLCSRQSNCRNVCGHCELCPGRTPAMLPADCTGGQNPMSPRYVCEGRQLCTDTVPCPSGQYCLLGCCLETVQ
jgi:hypothetical protein